PDEATVEIAVRLVGEVSLVRDDVIGAVGDLYEVREILCIPAVHFDRLDGFETAIVAYTTDVPVFGKSWGKPYLLGPGNIHVAHTSEERVSKKELLSASSIYQQMVKKIMSVECVCCVFVNM